MLGRARRRPMERSLHSSSSRWRLMNGPLGAAGSAAGQFSNCARGALFAHLCCQRLLVPIIALESLWAAFVWRPQSADSLAANKQHPDLSPSSPEVEKKAERQQPVAIN